MSVSDLQHVLAQCMGSENAAVWEAAESAQHATEQFKAGEISKEEYTDLLDDANRHLVIDQNMAEMGAKETLNSAINGLIMLAGAV